jgi:hypothetical protein
VDSATARSFRCTISKSSGRSKATRNAKRPGRQHDAGFAVSSSLAEQLQIGSMLGSWRWDPADAVALSHWTCAPILPQPLIATFVGAMLLHVHCGRQHRAEDVAAIRGPQVACMPQRALVASADRPQAAAACRTHGHPGHQSQHLVCCQRECNAIDCVSGCRLVSSIVESLWLVQRSPS